MERVIARICRESGGRVNVNVYVRDLNIPTDSSLSPNRQIEVIVDGLPLYHGRQLAIDATLVGPLSKNGLPRLGSHLRDGASLRHARQNKYNTYRDIVASRRCHLLVAGMEIGGRWSNEFLGFVRQLAEHKARSAPRLLHKATVSILNRRWQGMIAVATQRSFAMSLLLDTMGPSPCPDGSLPDWGELM